MKKLPQLTLRDLFWLVALMAMGCGWWVDHSRLSKVAAPVLEFLDTRRESGPGVLTYYVDEFTVWVEAEPTGSEPRLGPLTLDPVTEGALQK